LGQPLTVDSSLVVFDLLFLLERRDGSTVPMGRKLLSYHPNPSKKSLGYYQTSLRDEPAEGTRNSFRPGNSPRWRAKCRAFALSFNLCERFIKARHVGSRACRPENSFTPGPCGFDSPHDHFDLLPIRHARRFLQLDGLAMHYAVDHDAQEASPFRVSAWESFSCTPMLGSSDLSMVNNHHRLLLFRDLACRSK